MSVTPPSINLGPLTKAIGDFLVNPKLHKLAGSVVAGFNAIGITLHPSSTLSGHLAGTAFGTGYTILWHFIDSSWNSPKGSPPA